jgi:NYN domain
MAYPIQRSWMMFIDGENFTIRGQEFASQAGLTLVEGPFWKKDVYLWLPGLRGRQTSLITGQLGRDVSGTAVRAHYYTSVTGDDNLIRDTKRILWALEFQPEVFKKPKQQKSKGVDITLARDMLSHGYQDHYDIAVVVAGDGDYVPLIEEVKRAGKIVALSFFENHGLNESLKLAADDFFDLSPWFAERWRGYASPQP